MTKLILKVTDLPYIETSNNGNSIYTVTAQDDNENMYSIYWDLAEGFDPTIDEDEMDVADWKNPISVYNHETSKEMELSSIEIKWNSF